MQLKWELPKLRLAKNAIKIDPYQLLKVISFSNTLSKYRFVVLRFGLLCRAIKCPIETDNSTLTLLQNPFSN